MNDESWKTLFHPFERGLIDPPGPDTRWVFSGAAPGFVLPNGFSADLILIQPWRPAFLALQKQNYAVQPEVEKGETFDGALVLLGRHREDNHLRLRKAALAVRPGGMVVVAGGKTDGIGPLRKHLRESLPEIESASKHHGVALWFEVPASGLEALLPSPADPVRFDGMTIPPGVFSDDGPDPASIMLAGHFEGRLGGKIADLGAGWGYLGVEALKRCPDIAGLTCFEADWRSSHACHDNLAAFAKDGQSVDARWFDVLGEEIIETFDRVIMNPPFHAGRATRPELGIGFIQIASKILRPGGRLLMVANRNLPYETALENHFRRVERLAEDNAFKLFEAVR